MLYIRLYLKQYGNEEEVTLEGGTKIHR